MKHEEYEMLNDVDTLNMECGMEILMTEIRIKDILEIMKL